MPGSCGPSGCGPCRPRKTTKKPAKKSTTTKKSSTAKKSSTTKKAPSKRSSCGPCGLPKTKKAAAKKSTVRKSRGGCCDSYSDSTDSYDSHSTYCSCSECETDYSSDDCCSSRGCKSRR